MVSQLVGGGRTGRVGIGVVAIVFLGFAGLHLGTKSFKGCYQGSMPATLILSTAGLGDTTLSSDTGGSGLPPAPAPCGAARGSGKRKCWPVEPALAVQGGVLEVTITWGGGGRTVG